MKKIYKEINWRSTAGYTIDQTILVVAVIALLITLVIGSVGWDILNRASGTKLASQLRQIEDANGLFFGQHKAWPHTVDTTNIASAAQRMEILVQEIASPRINGYRSYLPGFEVDTGNVKHHFGSGGTITQSSGNAVCPGTGDYLVVTMTAVPEAEILEGDEGIDGSVDAAAGRFRYGAIVGGVADLTYCANVVD